MMSRQVLYAFVLAVGLGVARMLLGPAGDSKTARAQTTVSAPADPPAASLSTTTSSITSSSTAPTSAPATAAMLADCVPGDVMLYLETRGFESVLQSEVGAGVIAKLMGIIKGEPSSAPAGGLSAGASGETAGVLGLRHIFATAVGLTDAETIRLLFSGPLAVAADGWSGLSDAILVVRPANPATLEAALARWCATGSAGKVRRYNLNRDFVLACDGRSVVIGRTGKRTGLLARTAELLERGAAGSLAEQPEFRERMSSLSAASQLTIYVGRAASGGSTSPDPLTTWWPNDWPRLKTVALGLVLTSDGVTIKVASRLDPEGPQLTRSDPPIQIIRRLPSSVLATWTQAIDYVGGFRRLRSKYSQDADGFRFDAIEAGMEPGTIEKRLLSHLVGDTVLIIDQAAVKPHDAADANEWFILPTVALMVETDDPDAAAGVLAMLASNLARLLNAQLPPGEAASTRIEPAVAGGPPMYVVPLGQTLAGANRCDLPQAIELCATVADRWLIMGTHPRTVRRLVETRLGAPPTLAVGDLDRIIEQVVGRGGQPRRVLFAESRRCGAMIQTWIEHVSRHHPEMLQGQWWDKVLRQQRAMGQQMGILAKASDGTVEVVDTLPGGPARGRLQGGDHILAVDGIKIDPAYPLKSLREYVAKRVQDDRVVLQVRRDNATKEIVLPLPSEPMQSNMRSPVDLLKRLADVSGLYSSASYVLWQPRPDVADARIDLRYASIAATQPATTQRTLH